MAVAEGLDVHGLALLSYPLHPPGKPEKLRVEHWPQITAPCCFVSGDNDPFGRPDEFEAHLPELGGRAHTLWLDGGAHDPKKVAHRSKIVDEFDMWMFASTS